MKHLIGVATGKSYLRYQVRLPARAVFSTKNNGLPENADKDPKIEEVYQRVKQQENAHFASLSEKEKLYNEAYRLAMSKKIEETLADESLWWNKLKTMPEDEMSVMPLNFIKKYGEFLIKISEQKMETHLDYNKNLSSGQMYEQIRKLESLMTDEERREKERVREKLVQADTSYDYEKEGYMARQPRVDLTRYNYNYEQFKEYTHLYEQAKKKDQDQLKSFYKMVKYVNQNIHSGDKKALALAQKYRFDLITIPEEFKDVEPDTSIIKKDKRTRRPFIRQRSNRDISKYDAWRVSDRNILKGGGKQPCVTKVMLPPALIIKAFGHPTITRTGFEGTGEYDFEDANLDVFNLADYKQTDFYHGFNRDDSYYESDKNLKLPPHKRRRKYPTIGEFWSSMEPKEFKLYCSNQADWRKFKVWLKKQVREAATKDFTEEYTAKFAHEIDVCVGGDYDAVGKVNHTDIAVFKWDYTQFMDAEELKKLKEKPQALVPAKSLDLSKAERVVITKEELKRRELENEKLRDI